MSHGFACLLLGAGLALGASQWAKHATRGITDPAVVFIATVLIVVGGWNALKVLKKK